MLAGQKNNLVVCKSDSLLSQSNQSNQPNFPEIQSSEPLWQRAPTRDEKGKPYADFMMLIPGLRDFKPSYMREVVSKLELVLKQYEDVIVLADLNLKINVLWVTLEARLGLSTEVAALIHHLVPEAKLVSQHRAP